MENPYEILEIPEDATPKEIKRACQRLTVKYHPGKETGDIDKYYKVRAAYESITKKLSFAEQYHKFKNSYLGSDEEMNDLIKIYNKHKGDIKKIIDDHILCEYEDEDRIRRIVDELVAQKRLRLFTKFKKRIPEKMKKKRNVNLNELMEVMSKNDEKRKDLISRLEEKYCNQLEK